MSDTPFYFKGHARKDLVEIRKYTIKHWGESQWQKYRDVLFHRFQAIANNPHLGMNIKEISPNAFRFPDKNHVLYYLTRDKDVVFVGVISNSMAPKNHLDREKGIESELDF